MGETELLISVMFFVGALSKFSGSVKGGLDESFQVNDLEHHQIVFMVIPRLIC